MWLARQISFQMCDSSTSRLRDQSWVVHILPLLLAEDYELYDDGECPKKVLFLVFANGTIKGWEHPLLQG